MRTESAAASWLEPDDGTLHRFKAQQTILATGGYGCILLAAQAHTPVPVMAAAWPCGRVFLCGMEFVQFHPTGVYGVGALIMEGAAKAICATAMVSASGEVCTERKDLASRDVVSRSMTIEIVKAAAWVKAVTTFT